MSSSDFTKPEWQSEHGEDLLTEATPDGHEATEGATMSDKSTFDLTPWKGDSMTKQPKGRVVHCKRESYDVYIGRPSKWGNPFVLHNEADRTAVIKKYREWLLSKPALVAEARAELRGKILGCYCAPKACHGDVLLEIANAE